MATKTGDGIIALGATDSCDLTATENGGSAQRVTHLLLTSTAVGAFNITLGNTALVVTTITNGNTVIEVTVDRTLPQISTGTLPVGGAVYAFVEKQ